MNSLNLGNHVYGHFSRQRFTALILKKLCEPLKKKKNMKNHSFINGLIPSDSHQLVKAGTHTQKTA